MTGTARALSVGDGTDLVLVELMDRIADRLQAGATIDIDELVREHPKYAERIRQLLPAARLLAGLVGPVAESSAARDVAAPEMVAGMLGDFRILREVGRGGMGVVYEAEQVSLGRRVALKVLPFAATMDPRHLQRFQNEARAAASLEHPHIVPVYGVGCERGIHYYAMKFIDGQTLAGLIAQQQSDCVAGEFVSSDVVAGAEVLRSPGQRANAGASEYLSPGHVSTLAAETVPIAMGRTEPAPAGAAHFRRAAEWGIQAALALEHSHTVGIVHRDIKPANLMIDARGQLWVTDFGLARVLTDNGLTMTGDVLGTLRYMSPEQALAARGVVDHRTDIYSLGVTLYELLTHQPAFAAADRLHLLRQLELDEPTPPRRINMAIPAELETIVLKAMDKNPGDRYRAAQDLANDLRCYLDDKPIRAARPTLFQRGSKWARRHRSVVWFAGALTLMAIVGLVVTSLLIWQEKKRTDNALDEARAQALKAEAQRRRAVLNFDKTLNALTDMLNQLDAKDLAGIPQINQVRTKLSQHTLSYYSRLLDESNPDPEVRFETARAYISLGSLYRVLKDHPKARQAKEKSVALFSALTADYPLDPVYWKQRGHSHAYLAEDLEGAGLEARATEQYRQAVRAFMQVCQVAPKDHAGPNNLAYTLITRPGKPHFDPLRAVALGEQAVVLAPENADCWYTLGVANFRSGRWDAACIAFDRAITLATKASFEPDAYSLFHLAMAHQQLGRRLEAQRWFRQASEWMDEHAPESYELGRVREEATGLLRLKARNQVAD